MTYPHSKKKKGGVSHVYDDVKHEIVPAASQSSMTPEMASATTTMDMRLPRSIFLVLLGEKVRLNVDCSAQMKEPEPHIILVFLRKPLADVMVSKLANHAANSAASVTIEGGIVVTYQRPMRDSSGPNGVTPRVQFNPCTFTAGASSNRMLTTGIATSVTACWA